MSNETHIELLEAPLDASMNSSPTASPQRPNVTQSWGQIKARASDRIFDHTPERPKTVSSWQIAMELVVAALILLLFL